MSKISDFGVKLKSMEKWLRTRARKSPMYPKKELDQLRREFVQAIAKTKREDFGNEYPSWKDIDRILEIAKKLDKMDDCVATRLRWKGTSFLESGKRKLTPVTIKASDDEWEDGNP